MKAKHVIKLAIALLIFSIAVWAFQPPPPATSSEQGVGLAIEIGNPNARFELEVAPGLFYMPGVIPHGLGDKIHGIAEVARDFVQRFPDTRIVFRNVPAQNREWLTTALMGDQAPDILAVNVEDVWVDTQKGWYLPLDEYLEAPNPFVEPGRPGSEAWWDMFRYQAISRAKAAPIDRKMYCLTYDMVETGIYYNKSKFNELGLDLPETWAEFMDLQRRIKNEGYTPFITVIESISDWGVDVIFDQLYYDVLPGIDLSKDPIREAYLQGYLDWDEVALLITKGFFTGEDPRFREITRLLGEWRAYWNKDLSIRTMDRYRPFMSQKAIMIWDGSWLVHRMELSKSVGFDWGVFYLPPITRETSRFAPRERVETCVIGGAGQQFSITKRAWSDVKGNSDLERFANRHGSERLKRVVQFAQFMCLPENAERIVNESLQFIPNIVGVEARPEMQPFVEILERRYTTTKWINTFDLQYTDALRRMLSLYINNGCTLDGYFEKMDGFMRMGAQRAMQRKKPDMERLAKAWEDLAPLRADMEGLPDGAR